MSAGQTFPQNIENRFLKTSAASMHSYLLRECKYENSLICFDGKLFHRAVVILPKVRMWQHVGGKENDGSNALLVEA